MFYNHKIRWREKEVVHPLDWVRKSQLTLRMEIIWDRGGGHMMNAKMPYMRDERVYWLFKGPEWYWNQAAVVLGSVWQIAPQAFKDHSCVFPEKLVGNCLAMVAQPGMVVLDPYMGSATTLVVARQHGCQGIGIEQDARYVDVAIERLQQGTLDLWHPPSGEEAPTLL